MVKTSSGHLADPSTAPAAGERITVLAELPVGSSGAVVPGPVRIEHILSGKIDRPIDFLQTHDEWVTVLSGAAVLVVGTSRHQLVAGDWIFIGAGLPHQLRSVEPGTSWLAVHAGGTPATAHDRPASVGDC